MKKHNKPKTIQQKNKKPDVLKLSHDRERVLYLDEVGRGPLAGPVTVGCIIQTALNGAFQDFLSRVKDSKQLSTLQREQIVNEGKHYHENYALGIGSVSAHQIDRKGIIFALKNTALKAIFQALQHRGAMGKKTYSLSALRHFFVIEKGWKIVLDGNHDFGLEKVLGVEVITIIKGDALIPQISLASIHAKVTRDQYMEKQSEKFPAYGFEKHKGYGTLAHRAAIQKYGLCELHRETYCKNTRNIER